MAVVLGRVWLSPDVLANGNKVGLLQCPVPGCPNRPAPDQPICGWCRRRVAERNIKLIMGLTRRWLDYLEDAASPHCWREYKKVERAVLKMLTPKEA